MRTRIASEEHYTVCQHSKPFFQNGRPYTVSLVLRNTLQTLLWSHVACICAALIFLAWRKGNKALISQLAWLSTAKHIVPHSVWTRTNTKWPVTIMGWFTWHWVMWRYLTCARSLPLRLLSLLLIQAPWVSTQLASISSAICRRSCCPFSCCCTLQFQRRKILI
jgi:hypothetical protein